MKKMNLKCQNVQVNKKKKMSRYVVCYLLNFFLKEHKMMKTSPMPIFSSLEHRMQKKVVINPLVSNSQWIVSSGRKRKKKIPRHHHLHYFFYLEHRKMKMSPKLHLVQLARRMMRKNLRRHSFLKEHKMKRKSPGHHFFWLERKMMKKNPAHSFLMVHKMTRKNQGHHSFWLVRKTMKTNPGRHFFQLGHRMRRMNQGHHFSLMGHKTTKKSRERHFSLKERKMMKMSLMLHFFCLGCRKMKRSPMLLLVYLQLNFVLCKKKRMSSKHPIAFQMEHRKMKTSPERFLVCPILMIHPIFEKRVQIRCRSKKKLICMIDNNFN